MKILYHSLGNLNKLGGYPETLQAHLSEVTRDDTEIVVRGTSGGVGDFYRYFAHHDINEVTVNMLDALDDDVDAIALGNIYDPGLRQGRELLSIPVVGLGETSYHVAMMVGERFGMVPEDEKMEPFLRDNLRMYGIQDHLASIHGMNVGLDEMGAAFNDASIRSDLVATFERKAGTIVSEGAEVVLPGAGIVSMLMAKEGVREVDGAPVIDSIQVLVRMTETLVDLYDAGALSTSEKCMYKSPPPEELEYLRSEYDL